MKKKKLSSAPKNFFCILQKEIYSTINRLQSYFQTIQSQYTISFLSCVNHLFHCSAKVFILSMRYNNKVILPTIKPFFLYITFIMSFYELTFEYII